MSGHGENLLSTKGREEHLSLIREVTRRGAKNTSYIHEGPLRAAENIFLIREGTRRTHFFREGTRRDAKNSRGVLAFW